MARRGKKSGKDIADQFDLEQFKMLAGMPDLVRLVKDLAAANGRTFEEEVQIVTDAVREKFGVPRKGPAKPQPH
jgi:hypothetical protein